MLLLTDHSSCTTFFDGTLLEALPHFRKKCDLWKMTYMLKNLKIIFIKNNSRITITVVNRDCTE